MTRAWRPWLVVLASAVLILAVIAAFGHPTVFTDTDDYQSLGHELALDAGLVAPPELSDADIAQAKYDAHMGHTQMASRSALYGVFLFGAEAAGTLWLVAGLQAAATAWVVATLWRTALPGRRWWEPVAVIAGLALLTPLPFFAGFAMPDIFAAVAAIIAALLLFYPDRIERVERWGLAALLVFALGVHTSHVLLAVALVAVGSVTLVVLRVDRRAIVRRIGLLVGLIAVAVAANGAYGIGIRLTTGERLRNQPFLTARLLADGPGRDYLRHACAHETPYVLCRFKAKPLSDSEDVLWSDLPGTGVFMLSTYATRVKLEDQEGRFVVGTLAYAPVAQAVASLKNWGRQLLLAYVDDPVRTPAFYLNDPYWRQTTLPPMIARIEACGPRHDRCDSRLTVALSRRWHGALSIIAAVVAFAALGVLAWRSRRATPGPDRLVAAAVFLLLAVLINAGVCGVLSGPFARYQARIVWLIPLVAAMLVVGGRRTDRFDSGSPHR